VYGKVYGTPSITLCSLHRRLLAGFLTAGGPPEPAADDDLMR
jgi:hypothetical protein